MVASTGVETKPPGGAGRKPRWFRADREVVSDAYHGSVAAKPTTNSSPTNSQHDKVTTRTTSLASLDYQCGAVKEQMNCDQAGPPAAIVWRAVLESMRETMTERNYDRWFAPTVAARLEGKALTVSVPTEAHRHWLDVRLRRRIDDALRLLRYTDVRVTFIVGEYVRPARRCDRADIGGRQLP